MHQSIVRQWGLCLKSCFLSFCKVDRHLRKLDQELAKFKMELEADNAGITEVLEKSKGSIQWRCGTL